MRCGCWRDRTRDPDTRALADYLKTTKNVRCLLYFGVPAPRRRTVIIRRSDPAEETRVGSRRR